MHDFPARYKTTVYSLTLCLVLSGSSRATTINEHRVKSYKKSNFNSKETAEKENTRDRRVILVQHFGI
jgi:hypothetical protein